MKRTCIFLSEPQIDRLSADAKLLDVPFAEVVRRIIDRHYEPRELKPIQRTELCDETR